MLCAPREGACAMETAGRVSSTGAPLSPPALALPATTLLLLYAVLLLGGERLLNDPDTFLHIAAGNWIWAHGSVPRVDPFSASFAGTPWTAHEWLAELILAGAHALLGWGGVVLLAAAMVALAFAILAATAARSLAPLPGLALIGLSICLAAPHLAARPHVLALPILAFWAAALLRARAEVRPPSPALLPLMALWANLHAGFVFGLALAGAFAAEALLAAPDRARRIAALRGWGGFLAGAALLPLLNPHGIDLWLFPLRLLGQSFALDFVGEWHATDLSRVQALEIWLLALLALALATPLRLAPVRLLLLLGLAHLALRHARNAELLAMLAPLLLAAPIAAALP